MQTSTATDKIFEALSGAQASINAPKKDASGQARGGRYRYATLDAIIDATRKPLGAAGIAVLQEVEPADNWMVCRTRLVHSSGQWIETTHALELPTAHGPQDLGSVVTYARRYSLSAALGIAAEEDDDCASVTPRETPAAPRKKPESARAIKPGPLPLSEQLANLGIDEESITKCGLNPRKVAADKAALLAALPVLRSYSPSEIGSDPVAALAEALATVARKPTPL